MGHKIKREIWAASCAESEGKGSSGVSLTAEVYVYTKEDCFPPVIEWPDAVTDSDNLAGLWRADFIRGLT